MIDTLNLIYFSPTATTQKVVRGIGQGIGIESIKEYNITSSDCNFKTVLDKNSLTIIGIPTYSGRLPISAIERLKKIKANNSAVVIVAVYGNRAFDDSLLELKDIADNCGFKIIAAGGFIGEHSFSTSEKPIAKGRPDELDLIKIKEFSEKIKNKINTLKTNNIISEVEIPGNFPYKKRPESRPLISPESNNQVCNRCGKCVEVCPTNAISIIDNKVITNKELCIWCCACVKSCPMYARYFDNKPINAIREKLFSACSERKEPEIFI